MLPTKFRFIWLSSFREEDFQKSTNQKKELPMAAMFVDESGRNEYSLQRTFHRCFLPSFGSFGQTVSEEKIFRNRPIRNNNCLWWLCLLTNRDEMSSLYSGPSNFSSFGKVVSEEKIFQKSTNQKLEWPVAAMFINESELNAQSLQRTFQGCFLPSFDSFVQVVLEDKIFQESTNQNQEWSMAAMFVNRSGGNEQSLQRTFHRCFLPSFGLFGKVVSEEKIFRSRPIRNKNGLWWPCLLTDWN